MRENAMEATAKKGNGRRGEVPIWRRSMKSFYLGRFVRVTVLHVTPSEVQITVEAPLSLVVSGPKVALEDHLAAQQDRENTTRVEGSDLTAFTLDFDEVLRIGRTVSIRFGGEEGDARAALYVTAPVNVAITRDDFSREEHDALQAKRDPHARSPI